MDREPIALPSKGRRAQPVGKTVMNDSVTRSIRESYDRLPEEYARRIFDELQHKPLDRAISDNGPQFIAKDFKEFIRISGMTHVRTSPYYPQSNGKIERWHKSLKGECIRRERRCRSKMRGVWFRVT